jgi:ferritin-like metal-binding protein YciE
VSDLFRSELHQLLELERRLLDEVLPEMRERAQAVSLRAALDRHLLETKAHVNNLERILLLADVREAALGSDFEILATVLRTEAVEAASYGFLVHVAEALGVGEECVRLLRTNMEQDAYAGEEAEHALVALLAQQVENAEPAYGRPSAPTE